MPCFSSSLSRARLKMPCFFQFPFRDRKCCAFPIPFLQRVRSAVFFQFPFSFPVPFQFPSQFPSRIPYVFPRKVRCRLFSFKTENIFVISLKKVCDALSLEKHRESAKGTGKGTGRELEGNWERERELEKHSTSYTLKKRN